MLPNKNACPCQTAGPCQCLSWMSRGSVAISSESELTGAACVSRQSKQAPPPPPPHMPVRNPITAQIVGNCLAQVYYGRPWDSIYVLPYMSIIRVVRSL